MILLRICEEDRRSFVTQNVHAIVQYMLPMWLSMTVSEESGVPEGQSLQGLICSQVAERR